MTPAEVDDLVGKIRARWPGFPVEEVDVYRVSLAQHDFQTVRAALNGLGGPTPYDVLAQSLPALWGPLSEETRLAGLAHIARIRAANGWTVRESVVTSQNVNSEGATE